MLKNDSGVDKPVRINLENLNLGKHGQLYQLNRGGYIVFTSEGWIQIGVPPSTVKDSMTLPCGVPSIFCIPFHQFNWDMKVSLVEIEFPIYYNFFSKDKSTTFICLEEKRKELAEIIYPILKGENNRTEHSISDGFRNDVEEGQKIEQAIKKEVAYFNGYDVEKMYTFKGIEKKSQSSVVMGRVEISLNESLEYHIKDHAYDFEVTIPNQMVRNSFFNKIQSPEVPFKKVLSSSLAVTCVGSSNGFDPLDCTSSFLFWFEGRGVWVDPPQYGIKRLERMGIDVNYIDSVILTHVHADHDAGLFPLMLAKSGISVYTTQMVMDSWLYKYSRIVGWNQEKIKDLFNFYNVYLDEPLTIGNADFKFNYTFHSVPTLGFVFTFKGKKIAYSGDHLYDPKRYQEILGDSLSSKRYDQFMNFPWDSDVIFHEGGGAPLHTSIELLNSLPKEIQQKMFIYHLPENHMPENTEMTRLSSGMNVIFI